MSNEDENVDEQAAASTIEMETLYANENSGRLLVNGTMDNTAANNATVTPLEVPLDWRSRFLGPGHEEILGRRILSRQVMGIRTSKRKERRSKKRRKHNRNHPRENLSRGQGNQNGDSEMVYGVESVPGAESLNEEPGPSIEKSDIPGFAYDSVSKRYYKVQPESSGSEIGYRQSDFISANIVNNHKIFLQQRKLVPITPKSTSLTSILCRRELCQINGKNCALKVAELSLQKARIEPNFVHKVSPEYSCNFTGCQFLDVSKNGKTLTGCWSVPNFIGEGASLTEREGARIMSFRVDCDPNIISESGKKEGTSDNMEIGSNTYGLKFTPTCAPIFVGEPNVVDMLITRVDNSVTCVVYVTAECYVGLQGRLSNLCRIYIEPIADLSNEEDSDEIGSPIYNIRWTCRDQAWSCGFNNNKMRIGVGLEQNELIMDVVTEQIFRISSRKKCVISQQFTQQGDVMYMGLRNCNMICSDLRLHSSHIVGTFKESKSVGWMRLLSSQPNLLLSENFGGEMKLWDIRTRKCLISLEGHKKNHHKLPCFIDYDERFVFAVGGDGITRGWSLSSGSLLCSIPSPRPVLKKSDFPRVVYSENWGGIVGNAAIVLAVDSNVRVHELKF